MDRLFKHRFKIVLIVLLAIILSGCELDVEDVDNKVVSDKNDLVVYFIDVGQGDSAFIELPNGETSLIDGGTRAGRKELVNYLKDLGVEKIDYLIATHPHEDHIGGLPEVIRNFQIGKVYMPDKIANTAIFEELLLEIKNKDLKIDLAKGGDVILSNQGLKYEILAPNREKYEDTNDYSIVTKITYKNTSFLFTGDAEEISEKEMIKEEYDLSSDVLKVGHHGSSTSTSDEFLKEVEPEYAVISSGKDNSYGHPHKETLKKLENANIQIFRTDELGTISMISDGKSIKILGDNIQKETRDHSEEDYYIGNKNTKIYHHFKCKLLPKKENQIIFQTKEEAENQGFKPHENCVE